MNSLTPPRPPHLGPAAKMQQIRFLSIISSKRGFGKGPGPEPQFFAYNVGSVPTTLRRRRRPHLGLEARRRQVCLRSAVETRGGRRCDPNDLALLDLCQKEAIGRDVLS